MAKKGREGNEGKKVVIIGATSGIGRELAVTYLKNNTNNSVGITGRRTEELIDLQNQYLGRVFYRTMDVTKAGCETQLDKLIEEMGGMDLFIYSAGVGTQNKGPKLSAETEMPAIETNALGFTRLVIRAYNYFASSGGGRIVAIASLAGIRPLRQSPAYSSTKRFQMHYISCLAQKANREKTPVRFTTIIPSFIRTCMLKYDYPFTTSLEKGTALIYKAIEKNKRRKTIPGYWKIIEVAWRLIPMWEKVW